MNPPTKASVTAKALVEKWDVEKTIRMSALDQIELEQAIEAALLTARDEGIEAERAKSEKLKAALLVAEHHLNDSCDPFDTARNTIRAALAEYAGEK